MRWLLAIALLLQGGIAVAEDTSSWQWSFGPSGQRANMGTHSDASDGLDAYDVAYSPNPYINIAVHHEPGVDGWMGPSCVLASDLRAPLEFTPGQSKTWRMHYWNNIDSPSGWLNTDFTWHFVSERPSDCIQYWLTFVRLPIGMEEWTPPSYASPTLGERILLNERTEGNWVLWTYSTQNGLDGYVFDLTAVVVPEPSSLSILSLALASAGAWRLRRRR